MEVPDEKAEKGGVVSRDEDEDKEQRPALSKNQLKKELKWQRWAETKKERRKKEKERIKERKRKEMEERRKQGLDDLPGVKRTKMSDPEASRIRVAIDCAYDSFMTRIDIKKLIKQMQRCYAENRKSAKPLQFYVSSLRDESEKLMSTLVQGYLNWDVHFRAESPDAAFGAENIVYLAAESPNILQELDPAKVYIIGGLVDHNHHKGVCFQKVTEKGWSHAQLPIGDFVKLNSRKVLAVNHVFEIILAYIQLGNWRDAFYQVLPSRKVAQFYSPDDPSPTPGNAPTADTPSSATSLCLQSSKYLCGDNQAREEESTLRGQKESAHQGEKERTPQGGDVGNLGVSEDHRASSQEGKGDADRPHGGDTGSSEEADESVTSRVNREPVEECAQTNQESSEDIRDAEETKDVCRDLGMLEAGSTTDVKEKDAGSEQSTEGNPGCVKGNR